MGDEFSDQTKRHLAQRVGNLCSNPDCRALTSGPQADPAKSVNLGVAAHITAASPGGPRYEPSLLPEERSAPLNGIWLCQNCGKLVDNDPQRFNIEILRLWKQDAESEAYNRVGKTAPARHRPAAESPSLDLRQRINELIVEGMRLNDQCQRIFKPYETQIESCPDIANAITSWQQRAETVLSSDVDHRPLQMWRNSVTSTTPGRHCTVGFYCATLTTKISVLTRIIKRKNTTPQQLEGQLSVFILEGNSLKQSCLDGGELNEIMKREISWLSRVQEWFGDNFDEESFQAFNDAPPSTEVNMHCDQIPEIAAIWRRTKGRIEVLRTISKGGEWMRLI